MTNNKEEITSLKNNNIAKRKIKRVIVQNKIESNPEDRSAFSETFLLGKLADLLYEIKSIAKATARTRNTKTKKASVTKLRALLGQYHKLLGTDFKGIISVFIYDTFKSLRVPNQDLTEIKSWWLKM